MPTEQRFTFDEVAELYDRSRPRYPNALFEDLVALSGIPRDGRILEIGCGTGQATAFLAERGFSVLCLEPGPSMAQCARQNLARFSRVEILQQTFEAWPVERDAFDLAISAQAFHWLTPEVRFAKVAQALHASGALAVIGNAVALERSPLRDAIDAEYARSAPSLVGPAVAGWYADDGPVVGLFGASGCFAGVESRRYPWRQVYSASQYCDLLRTHSDHRLLADDQRESLLDGISNAIRSHGDAIEVAYDAHLYLARRIDVTTRLAE